MCTAKPRMVVPYGLKTLLEGVSRAVLKASPSNITEFAAVYFRELIVFREEHPNLDIKDLVREFHCTRVEGWAEGTGGAPRGQAKRADVGDAYRSDSTPISDEPKRKEKSTDTEEDQINEEPEREQATKTTQYPSVVDDFGDKTGDEKGAGLAYVPADPAQLAAQMLAMATSEPGQPPPYSNVWTLYCLTDLKQQGRKSPPPPPPPLPPIGTGAPVPQATLFISSGKDQQQYLQPQMIQQGQPPQVSSPTYVMMEDGKKGSAPPFILVGSSVQNKQDWKPIPGHTVLAQPDTGGTVRRFATIPVPVARPADAKTANPNFNSAQDSGRPPTPVFLSVAIPLEDVMTGKGSGAGDKTPFAGSYGIAGEITFASVRRTE
ncbi:calcium-binding tyrosine phosphorylation-regulated protein isoform X2 [Hemicordylus capensis]|uniref:calcium-binding tyrosine phosphorylation-regulated protein isoform X2 n=1 Tax=Hemicordylus capensis TaxID=884348 RepID=UPI0023040CE8|nr:calcium-binding tyrosine phosphorylation-regulated protein isoform X2 [Hemicordylus capensis]